MSKLGQKIYIFSSYHASLSARSTKKMATVSHKKVVYKEVLLFVIISFYLYTLNIN